MALSPEIQNIIRTVMREHGVPMEAYPFIAAIAVGESSGNPRARRHSDNADLAAKGYSVQPEDSVGLFQLNRMGGRGTGYSVQQLMDPWFNTRKNMPAMKAAFERLGGVRAAQADPSGFLEKFYPAAQGSIPISRNYAGQLLERAGSSASPSDPTPPATGTGGAGVDPISTYYTDRVDDLLRRKAQIEKMLSTRTIDVPGVGRQTVPPEIRQRLEGELAEINATLDAMIPEARAEGRGDIADEIERKAAMQADEALAQGWARIGLEQEGLEQGWASLDLQKIANDIAAGRLTLDEGIARMNEMFRKQELELAQQQESRARAQFVSDEMDRAARWAPSEPGKSDYSARDISEAHGRLLGAHGYDPDETIVQYGQTRMVDPKNLLAQYDQQTVGAYEGSMLPEESVVPDTTLPERQGTSEPLFGGGGGGGTPAPPGAGAGGGGMPPPPGAEMGIRDETGRFAGSTQPPQAPPPRGAATPPPGHPASTSPPGSSLLPMPWMPDAVHYYDDTHAGRPSLIPAPRAMPGLFTGVH